MPTSDRARRRAASTGEPITAARIGGPPDEVADFCDTDLAGDVLTDDPRCRTSLTARGRTLIRPEGSGSWSPVG